MKKLKRGEVAVQLIKQGWDDHRDVARAAEIGEAYAYALFRRCGVRPKRKKTVKNKAVVSRVYNVIAALQAGFNGAEIGRMNKVSRQYVNQVKDNCERAGVRL